MKKLVSIVLAVAIILCVMPLGAFTFVASAEKSSYYTYTVQNNSAIITKVDTSISGDITVPSYLGEYPVVSISDSAFYNCKRITSIVLPNSVTDIGYSAFAWCEKLKNVTIPNTVTSIGDYAFSFCKTLSSITIPNSVTSVGNGAFCGCASIESVTIPNSVTSINANAFDGCTSLASITISNSVTSIGDSAFSGCTGLTSITIPNSVKSIGGSAFDGCTGLTGITIPDSVISIGESAFVNTAYYQDETNWEENILYINNHLIKAKEIFAGYCVVKNGTKVIADRAFNWCENLTSVILTGSVVSIGNAAFYRCDELISITIPDGVTYIGNEAFNYCSNLENLKIPSGIKTIGNRVFFFCSKLTSVTVPNGVTSIGNEAFKGCTGLTKITIPNSVTSIGNSAFNFCNNLKSVVIPKSVIDIGSNAIDSRYISTVYCYVNSYAEIYSKNHSIPSTRIWDISTKTTAVYNITPNKTIGSFNKNSITVFDKNGNEIPYNESKKGWPLTKGLNYIVSYKNTTVETSSLNWNLTKQASKIFDDTSSAAWYHDAVTYVASVGLLKGYDNGDFGASDNIKRQDFLVILARFDGVDLTQYDYKSKLTDVKNNGYYKTAVNWAIENGITTGYSNGKFGVDDKMTREQLVTFLYRYAQYKGIDVSVSSSEVDAVKTKYKDFKKISDFSKDAIVWVVKNEIITGKDSKTIAPQGNAQRCEVAKIMYNIFLNNTF